MERVKRRWWTWAITLLAAIVIVGAVISGLFQIAVLALPSYRADLSAWITHVADRPVQIGGVNLGWRGIEPRLDLSDITLFSEDGDESLTLDRLSLGFNPLRLLRGDLLPDRLEVSGLALELELDAEGRWSVAGFAPGQNALSEESRRAWEKDLARFGHVIVQNCTLHFSGPRFGPEGQSLRVTRMELDQRENGFELEGRVQLPVTHGDIVDVSADLDGPLIEPAQWRGDFELDARRLRPQGWLAPYLQPGVQIGAENFDATLEGRLAAGRVQSAELRIDSDALAVARDGHASGAKSARLRATLHGEARGWLVDLRELSFDDERLAQGSLRWSTDTAGEELDVDADELHLGRLMPWTSVWRSESKLAAQASRLSGTLRNLVLRLRRGADGALRYSATGRLDDLALAADAQLGLAHLSGEVSASESGGQLRLAQVPLELQLPAQFARPVEFDAVDAQLQWRRGAAGWQLASPAFAFRTAGADGSGRFELELPRDDGESPRLDLNARFAVQDFNRLKPYMPQHWSQHLRDWLEHGLTGGRAPHGELTLRGPLRDFPFVERPDGVWKLDADVAGVDLAFAPNWPPLDDLGAHLSIAGRSLTVSTTVARLNGNRIDRAVARFDDVNSGLLEVDASTGGEIARFYDFLRASPLHERLSGLLDQTRAAGNAQVGVQLELPLHDLKSTKVHGSVALDDVQMFYAKLDSPVSGIKGSLQFDEQGVSGEGLTARFEDLPLAARIERRAGTHGVVLVDFPFTPNADGLGVSRFLPGFVREALEGTSAWRAELPIEAHGGTALTLTSELRGTAVGLPEPLAKPADAAAPVSVRISGDADAPLRIGVAYAQRLGADLALSGGAAGTALDGMHVRFGDAPPPKAVKGSYLVDGRADTVDLGAWTALFTAPSAGGTAGAAAAPDAGRLQLDLIDLELAHLRWQHQLSGATRLRWQPQGNGWHVTLAGEGAQGAVDWNGPAPGRLVARLERLALTPQTPPEGEAASPAEAGAAAEPPGPPAEPAHWPEIDLICEQLSGKGADFGRVELRSSRIAGGQRLDKLTVAGGVLGLDAVGQWRRSEGRSTAELHAKIDSEDFEAVLKALDYAQSFRAKRTQVQADLKWAPSPTGLVWQAAEGRVDIGAENGQLRAVKPGAGRVLGLFNFYALPRRLTLNFSDVVDEGLGFDRIDGHFDLGNGAAVTDDLTIKGPSVKIDMRGRIGLAARDYDERVTVYPAGISSGVTLGAALLGGPALGALVLLAQEVMDKPLDQVTQLTYHVSGSWDNPKIEKIDARSAKPAAGAKKK